MSKMNFSLFEQDWSAEDQLLLFQGLKNHGFGNWKHIADFIGTKTAEEVEAHYCRYFLNNPPSFMPDPKDILSRRQQKYRRQRIYRQSQRKKARDEGKNPNKMQKPVSLPHANQGGQIVGYMPLRGDFQIEYDNDAQLLLAQMQFNDDDTQQQKQIKKRLLQIYNLRIDERIKRKKFVIERDLLDFKKQSELDKKRTKEEKEIYNMMKAFARFNTPEDHQKLVEGLLEEKKIRQRIEELKQYRRLGFKTFAEVEAFIEQQRAGAGEHRAKTPRPSDGYVWESRGSTTQRNRPKPQKADKSGTSVLNDEEERLCDSLELSLYHYLIMKETMVRESLREGSIRKDEAQKMFKIDRKKVHKVYDYLISTKKIQDRK